jgi:arginase
MQVTILGAPTELGLKPYDDGTPRGTRDAPRCLRERGLGDRLRAQDAGDVSAPSYRDFVRPPGGVRNEDLVHDHVCALAGVLSSLSGFPLVLGGDCSILLGSLLGLRGDRELGLVYLDGHSDFNTPGTSETGGVAGMDLALATGHGDSILSSLGGGRPLVRAEHVVALGVREGDFGDSGIVRTDTAEDALLRLHGRDFFIHLDVDVLDPFWMPFVDEPAEQGLTPDELVSALARLAHHPRARGVEVTIYDPRQDPFGEGATLIVDILEKALRD